MASYIPKVRASATHIKVLFDALLLKGVPTRVIRESNRHDHLL